MAASADHSGYEQVQAEQPLSPRAQFQAAAQLANDRVSDEILYQQLRHFNNQHTSTEAGPVRAQAATAAPSQSAAPQKHPIQYQNTQRPIQAPGPRYHPAQHLPAQYLPMHNPYQAPNTNPSWQQPQWPRPPFNHNSQQGVHQSIAPSRTAYPTQSYPHPTRSTKRGQVEPAPAVQNGMMGPNGQLHHPAPTRPITFNPQSSPSPSVTPVNSSFTTASPFTPQRVISTPASSISDVPSSNLASKQHASRKHTKVNEIDDPAMCHLCFHQVVLKSSIKNHLVSVHGINKEVALATPIYNKSELLAQGYRIPTDLKPSRITNNAQAAVYSTKKYALDLSATRSVPQNVATSLSKGPDEMKDPPSVNVKTEVKAPSYPPLNAHHQPTTSEAISYAETANEPKKKYALNLNPPGLAAVDKGSAAIESGAVKHVPAVGGVFTGVRTASAEPNEVTRMKQGESLTKSFARSESSVKQPNGHVASTVPAKRTHDEASEIQQRLPQGPHKPVSQTILKTSRTPPPTKASGSSIGATNASRYPGWDSLPEAAKSALNQIIIKAQTINAVAPWVGAVNEGLRRYQPLDRAYSHRELEAIAHAALFQVDANSRRAYADHNGVSALPLSDKSAENTIRPAVDNHEGIFSPILEKPELSTTDSSEESQDEEYEFPHKRMRMSYGEILVPDDYEPDERMANIQDRDVASDAEGSIRTRNTSPASVSREAVEVEVYDDPSTNEDDSGWELSGYTQGNNR